MSNFSKILFLGLSLISSSSLKPYTGSQSSIGSHSSHGDGGTPNWPSVGLDVTKWNERFPDHYDPRDRTGASSTGWFTPRDYNNGARGQGSVRARAGSNYAGVYSGASYGFNNAGNGKNWKDAKVVNLDANAGVGVNLLGMDLGAGANFKNHFDNKDGGFGVEASVGVNGDIVPGVGVSYGIGAGLSAGKDPRTGSVGLSAMTPIGAFGAHLGGCEWKLCVFACFSIKSC